MKIESYMNQYNYLNVTPKENAGNGGASYAEVLAKNEVDSEKTITNNTEARKPDVMHIDKRNMTAYTNGVKMDRQYMNLWLQGLSHDEIIKSMSRFIGS
jgi:hypothetical protein